MKVKNRSDVALRNLLLVVSVNQESENNPVRAERRLDNIGDVLFVCDRVKIRKLRARMLRMARKVEIRSVGDSPKLAPAEREHKLNIRGGL